MLELACPNCGSKDMKKKDETYECAFCGSRFILTATEPKSRHYLDMPEDDGDTIIDEDTAKKIDELEDRMFDQREAFQNEACQQTAGELLKLAPRHAHAWALLAFSEINKQTLAAELCDASLVVDAMENAIRYAKPEHYRNISTCVYNYIKHFKKDLLKHDIDLSVRLEVMEKYILQTQQTRSSQSGEND